jgi:hypothetical protein
MNVEAPPSNPSTRRRPTLSLVAIGIAAGALIGLLAAAIVGSDDSAPSITLAPVDSVYPPDQASNAAKFLDAWDRYRHATFRAELSYSRTTAGGARLDTTRVVVQQPPRRMVLQDGSVSSIDGDKTVLCEPRNNQSVCTTTPGVDYEGSITSELAAWRTAITGSTPAYAVQIPQSGCFDLELVETIPQPPYGDATRVCFDDATGALRSRQVNAASGSESEEATSITATVRDEDWVTPGG